MRNMEEIIQAYLTDDMTDHEKTAFEKELQNDESLLSRVSIYQEMDTLLSEDDWALIPANTSNASINEYRDFFEGKEGKRVSASIKNTESKYFEQERSSENVQSNTWYGMTAAVILLMVSATTFFLLKQENSTQELYAYYDSEQELPSFTSREAENTLSKIENLYATHHYEEALTLIEVYSSDEMERFNSRIYIYQGYALLKLNQDQQALVAFEKLLLSNSLDSFKSHWYLALAYLKMDNKEKAIEEIHKLLESPHKFKEKEAHELLEKLD